MSNLATERFQTGNRVFIFASGAGRNQLLGTGTLGDRVPDAGSVDMTSNTGAREVHVVGDAEPQDIVDGAHTYEVSLALMKLNDRNAVDIVKAGPIDIQEIDRFTNAPLGVARECHLRSGRIGTPANQLVSRNLTFAAMSIS